MEKRIALAAQVLGLALAAACTALAAPAAASCSQPNAELVWSFPADGATDVPAGITSLWVLATSWSQPLSATIDGKAVNGMSDRGFGGTQVMVEALSGDADHVLELTYDRNQQATVHFHTTSAKPMSSDSPPGVQGHRLEEPPTDASCQAVLQAQDCFDNGQGSFVRFETETRPAAIAWLVQHKESDDAASFWPATCGDAALFGASQRLTNGCFVLRAIDATGTLSQPTEYCIEEKSEDEAPKTIGCSMERSSASPASPAFTALGLYLLLTWRSSKRRRQ